MRKKNEELRAELSILSSIGFSTNDIAEVLDMHPRTVRYYLGPNPPQEKLRSTIFPEDELFIKELHQLGAPLEHIALILRLNGKLIYDLIHQSKNA